MKSRIALTFLSIMVLCQAYAYDIKVENADGVTIYYYYINEGTELGVTRYGNNCYYGKVNIPEEVTYKNRTRKVTSIGESVFCGMRDLTSVTIPNSVTSIGDAAFYGCSGLTSVTIGNSVTSIGEKVFRECTGLTSVTIPNSVTSIGYETFYYCTSLKSVTIGNSVKSIGERAFYECFNLTSVTIGNSVKSIGSNAFYGCANLRKVIFKDIAAWFNIAFANPSDNPLNYAHHLYSDENTEITDLVIPNSVTSIGDAAFYGCSGLTSVTIPNSVTSIGRYAFKNCTGLTSLTIPNSVTSIGLEVFYGCTGLTSVTIPNSVTSIGSFAFDGCSGLTSVISLIKNPFAIDGLYFDYDTYYNATLYVPTGTIEKYKSTDYWSKFIFIEEGGPGSSTLPEEKKCATPTINYANKKLTFSCETEGVEYHYTINDADIKSGSSSSVSLTATYEISVYATKSGFVNSDVATATLVWTEAIFTETTPSAPSSAKAIRESIPVLISTNNGNITVKCEADGQPITVYSVDGHTLGSSVIKNGQAIISTNLQKGEVAIVKVGSKSVKILIQ